MGNLLACFGGQEKGGKSSSTRRKQPPGKRRSLPCQQQLPPQQVYGNPETNGQRAALPPAATHRLSPELNAADGKPIHGLLTCLEENGHALLDGTCDDTSSLDVHKQPSFKSSPTAAQLSPSRSPKKKVTFDLNVKTYDHVPAAEAAEEEDPEDTRLDGEATPLVKDDQAERAQERQEVPGFPGNNRYQNCADSDEDDGGLFCDLEDDDGCDDSDLEEEGIADAVGGTQEEEESFDSYFSLQMDKDRLDCSSKGEANGDEAISVSSQDSKCLTPVVLSRGAATRDRSKYVNSVLNPVENITQWKDVKAGRKNVQVKLPPQEKENILAKTGMPEIPSSPEPQIRPQSPNSQKSLELSPWTTTAAAAAGGGAKREVSVDTSLSSWLTPTQAASAAAKASSRCSNSSFSQENSYRSNNNSYTSLEERPILGALTVDDIKRTASSATPSPRKSPSRSPDEMPIMGTVGSYWKHTEQEADSGFSRCGSGSAASAKGIPNSTSKYREDKRVNWHSTPFEARLERALNKGSEAAQTPPFAVC